MSDRLAARLFRCTGALIALAALAACAVGDAKRGQPAGQPSASARTIDATAARDAAASAALGRPARDGAASRAPRAGEVEVCGVGIVSVSREDPSGAGAIPLRARARAQVDLLELGERAGDPRVRAAALTVASRLGGDVVDGQPMRRDADAALQRLARLAASSKDPAVYAMAVDSCRALTADRRRGGDCKAVSGWQWARIDRNNAVPWLSLAALAQSRRDAKSEDTAMKRAAEAKRVEWHMATLADRLLEALPPDTPAASRAVLSHEARTVGFHLGGLSAPGRYCTEKSLRNRDRRQTCERIARLMLDRGTGLHDVATAWRVGEHVGWPTARVTALRDESDRLDRLVLAEQRGTYGPLSCGALERQREWASRVKAMGEVAAARDLVRRPTHVQLGSEVETAGGGASGAAAVPTSAIRR